jgi:hypothetical protein
MGASFLVGVVVVHGVDAVLALAQPLLVHQHLLHGEV